LFVRFELSETSNELTACRLSIKNDFFLCALLEPFDDDDGEDRSYSLLLVCFFSLRFFFDFPFGADKSLVEWPHAPFSLSLMKLFFLKLINNSGYL
jgi:hypothetical protein